MNVSGDSEFGTINIFTNETLNSEDRHFFGLFKREEKLTAEEIEYLKEEISMIGADLKHFRFNEGEGDMF